jgi:hypothetical protein
MRDNGPSRGDGMGQKMGQGASNRHGLILCIKAAGALCVSKLILLLARRKRGYRLSTVTP